MIGAGWPTTALLAADKSARRSCCVFAVLIASACGRISFDPLAGTDASSAQVADAGLCTPNGCETPPSACHASSGECVDGTCSYLPLNSGESCDDGNVLTQDDVCDADGVCTGTASNAWPMIFDNSFSSVSIAGIGVDASGGLYSAVRFEGSWNGAGFDANLSSSGISYSNQSWVDTALMKLTSDSASPSWDYSFAGASGRVEAYCFNVLPDGTSFVAGHLRSRADFGAFGAPDVGGTQHPLIFTHDSEGGLSSVDFYEPGSQNAQIHGIAVGANFVAITGVYGGDVDFGAGGIGGTTGDDGYIAVFDRALTLQWARRVGGSGTVYGKGTHSISSGVTWAVGYFTETVDIGAGAIPTTGGRDVWFGSYDSLGGLRWGHTWGSVSNEGEPRLLGDEQGNTYVVGRFSTTFAIAGSGPLASAGGEDVYVAAFDDAGVLRWLKNFGSESSDSVVDIGFLADGSLWIAGGFDGTLTADGLSKTSAGATDGYVVVLDTNDGAASKLSTMASASDLSLQAVAVDEARAVIWIGGAVNGTVELGASTVSAGKAYIYPFPF
tara:strand:- start:60059 stop:61717 length:1659 start_codon:yes stop_codon:yes gene_type:complete